MATETTDYVCRKCHQSVDHGVRKCPECGYSSGLRGAGNRAAARWYSGAKWVSYLSIIGIPIGLWIRRKQRRAQQADAAGVAVPADEV